MGPRFVAATLMCTLAQLPTGPGTAAAQAGSPPSIASLQQLIDSAAAPAECKGMAIGVEQSNVRAERFYGTTGNRGTPDEDTEFAIGSITKTLTATLLAWEDQQGAMHLDDPLQKYAPTGTTVPIFNGRPILLSDLAEHTSGLPRNMPTQGSETQPPAAWAYLASYHLTRPPGQTFLYSNLGFGLLGLAIVKKEGTSLDVLLQRVITGPLGMPDTAITLKRAQQARLAKGYAANGRPAVKGSPQFPAISAAGAARSTLKDMMRYLVFELGEAGSALDPLLPPLQQPRHAAGKGSVGLSWQIQTLGNGTTIIAKDGAVPGFSAFMVFAPATKTGAVILANQTKCPVQKIGATLISALNQSTQLLDIPSSSDDDD
jgi:CubicO group peptidase (beta-lactamase class C family)